MGDDGLLIPREFDAMIYAGGSGYKTKYKLDKDMEQLGVRLQISPVDYIAALSKASAC